jgi:N4-gp56 family major capsid protein
MAMLTTATGSLAATMKTFFRKNLIQNARNKFVHQQFGDQYDIPKNGGKTQEWRKATVLATATTPLPEGSPPTEDTFTYTTVTVTVAQYGAWVKGSDLLQYTTFDDLLRDVTTEQGDQAGRTIEEITRDALAGGTNVRLAGAVAARINIASTNKLSSLEIGIARRTLVNNLAEPVQGAYYGAIIHPFTEFDLFQDSSIVAAMNAGSRGGDQVQKGEIGRYMSMIFVVSPMAKVFTGAGAGGINVYGSLFIGAKAYGVSKITGLGMQHISHELDSEDKADPLNQYWTSGWKTSHAVQILQQNFMLRLEHAASV